MNRVRRRALSARPVLCVLLSSAGIVMQAVDAISGTPGKGALTDLCSNPRRSKRTELSSLSRPSPPRRAAADLRGGRSASDDDPYQRDAYYTHPDAGASNPPNNYYEDGFANYNPPPPPGDAPGGTYDDPQRLFQESVQERVDRWKSDQMEHYSKLSAAEEANPRDAQGRLKLLQNVGRGSRAFIFFCLVLRDLHLLDVADTSLRGAGRLVARTLMAVLFVANMAGTAASLTSPGHSGKNRLKAILNLDKLVETGLFGWSFLRLTLFPSPRVQREIYVASIFHSLFFILQMQAFTKLTWDEGVAPPMATRTKADVQAQSGGRSWEDDHQTLGHTMDSYGDDPNLYAEASNTANSYYEDPAPTTGGQYY